MRLLVKNQKENEPKEPVMPDKEEAKSPFVMKKYKTELKQYYYKEERYEEHKAKIFVIVKILLQGRKIRGAQSKDICDCKGTVYPEYEEQS
jgi:hypothetical protein